MRLLAPAAALLALPPGTALAHSSLEGIGAFPNGLLHPVLDPAHILCFVACGLLAAHQPASAMPRLFLAAILSLAAGLILATFDIPAWDARIGVGIWTGTLAMGALIAATAARPYPGVAALMGFTCLAVGLDTRLENAAIVERLVFAFGTWMGAALIVVNLALACRRAAQFPLAQVGIRILGSWVAAAAAMMLAFSLKTSGV
ncbi:HupE/UreJ family protein [Pacificispira sp.]|jgi:urease accessory protein|uniref:HupE/UreJ family protein n=1 Tax=Pacificispira sp. TaxID=2888761 RepID=UPI003B52E27E